MAFFKRGVLKSSRKIRRKKSFFIFSLILCSFLMVIAGITYVSQIERLLIKKISISGNKTISTENIYKTFEKKITNKYLYLFPTNNVLLYPRGEISNLIKKSFLKIDKVSIGLDGLEKINIEVLERASAFVWSEKRTPPYFYMDKTGLIFEDAPNFSSGVFFNIEGGLSKEERDDAKLGKIILGENKLYSLIKFKDEVEEIIQRSVGEKWKSVSLFINEEEDFNLIFSDYAQEEWGIIFSAKDDVIKIDKNDNEGILRAGEEDEIGGFESDLINIARNLEITVTSPSFKNSLDESGGLPEYIDLRFGKKVFYKFKTREIVGG